MSSKTTLYVVRHGLSVFNKDKVISGHVDPPLTDEGRDQARATREELSHVDFDIVYSSDLQRAVETAEIISGRQIPHSNKLKGFRERSFGSIDGLPDKHLDGSIDNQMALSPEERWHYKHVPDMESDHELGTRFTEALHDIASGNPGKTILVGAHGGAIRTMLMKFGWADHDELKPGSFKNAGYVKLTYSDGNFSIDKVVGAERKLWNKTPGEA